MRLLLVLFLVGCTHAEPIAADPASPPAAMVPAAVVVAPVTEADTKRVEAALQLPVYGSDAAAPLALGTACDASSVLCGTAKGVALHARSWPSPEARPCAATVIGAAPDPLNASNVTSACIVDNRLYTQTTCTMCRLLTGTALDAQLDQLTPAQREYLRRRLVLTANAPLASVSDWRGALRAVTAP